MLDFVLVLIHVPTGLTAIIAGLVAMFSKKGGWWHRRAGDIYLLCIIILLLTAAGLVWTRGFEFSHLFALGSVAAALAGLAYSCRRINRPAHIAGMGGSYVAVMTAFYVDNGPKLPFWEMFPQAFFWVAPAVVGLPLIVKAVLRWRA